VLAHSIPATFSLLCRHHLQSYAATRYNVIAPLLAGKNIIPAGEVDGAIAGFLSFSKARI
jgi:hypothetical protein